jgi:hypothetical protein
MKLTTEQELIVSTLQAYAAQQGWEVAPIMKVDGTMLGVIIGESGIVDYFAEEDE